MQPPYSKKRQKNSILSKFYSLSIVLYTEKKYLVNRTLKKLYKNININEQSVHIHHLITTLLCIPP